MTNGFGSLRPRWAVTLALTAISLAFATSTNASTAFLGHPLALSADSHGHVWVAESDAHGVVEIDPSTGAVLRVVAGPAYGFDGPTAIAVAGGNVWVASAGFTGSKGNASAARLTEFSPTTGRLIRIVDLKSHGVQGLSELWPSGSTLWVSASMGNAIVELDVRTGRILRVFRDGPIVGNSEPSGIVTSDGRVMYVDQGQTRIVVRDVATGRIARTFTPQILARAPGTSSKVPFYLGPHLLAVTPTDIWAVCGAGRHLPTGSVIEIDRRSGHIERSLDAVSNDLYSSSQVASDAGRLFILGGPVGTSRGTRGAALTVIDERSGATLYVVHFLRLNGAYSYPRGLTVADGRVLVSDAGVNSIIVLSPATGHIVRVIR